MLQSRKLRVIAQDTGSQQHLPCLTRQGSTKRRVPSVLLWKQLQDAGWGAFVALRPSAYSTDRPASSMTAIHNGGQRLAADSHSVGIGPHVCLVANPSSCVKTTRETKNPVARLLFPRTA